MKAIKQKFIFLLVVCLLTSSVGIPTLAASNITPSTYSMDPVSAQAGDSVNVPVYISNCDKVVTFIMYLKYNPAVLSFEDSNSDVLIPAEISDEFALDTDLIGNNTIRIMGESQKDGLTCTDKKLLVTLKLKLLYSAKKGTYPLEFVVSNNTYEEHNYPSYQSDYTITVPNVQNSTITVTKGPISPPSNGGGPGGGGGSTPTPSPSFTPVESLSLQKVSDIITSLKQTADTTTAYNKYKIIDFAASQWDEFTSVDYNPKSVTKTNNSYTAQVGYSDVNLGIENANLFSPLLSKAITDSGAKDALRRSLSLVMPDEQGATEYQMTLKSDFLSPWASNEDLDSFVIKTPVFDAVLDKATMQQIQKTSPASCKLTFKSDTQNGKQVYSLNVSDSNGKQIDQVYTGGITLILPVTLADTGFTNESEAFASYISADGTYTPEAGSIFYANENNFYVPLTEENAITFVNSDISFDDTADASWAVPYINGLAARKVLSGVGENKFEPNRNVTREEFTKMIIAAFGLLDETATCNFSDVPQDAWYYQYVATAAKYGIVNGMGDNQFGVGMQISRQDMATIAKRAADACNKTIRTTKEKTTFADDSDISSYAKENIDIMQMAGIISGMGDNLFEPGASATRAQAAKVIYMLFASK